jgi:hypothetical protein
MATLSNVRFLIKQTPTTPWCIVYVTVALATSHRQIVPTCQRSNPTCCPWLWNTYTLFGHTQDWLSIDGCMSNSYESARVRENAAYAASVDRLTSYIV